MIKNKWFFSWMTLSIFMLLLSCAENEIKTSSDRLTIPEPDKPLRLAAEVKEALLKVPDEITDSQQLDSCIDGQKLIASGKEILPYLRELFTDSTKTTLFSAPNNRTLTLGELAIVVADEIKPIPIAYVVGVQQCTPPFHDVESFLSRIEKDREDFLSKYDKWVKEKE